jgi:DNA-binding LytR/AlgR family response regulator
MKVLIVEDELIAFEKLKILLSRVAPEINIIGHAKSIDEGIELIENIPVIDLAFFDIQLEDGLSFSILEHVKKKFPVIFTTAYDDYAIRAFDHHSIAYLLKPIQKADLEKALDKFNSTQSISNYSELLLQAINDARKVNYKERFTVKIGEKIRLFDISDIACFFSRDKGSFLCTNEAKQYVIDYPLDQLETMVDPKKHFRVNRKHIIGIDAIDKIIQHSNSRLKVVLKTTIDEDVIVAREKVKTFKNWLE